MPEKIISFFKEKGPLPKKQSPEMLETLREDSEKSKTILEQRKKILKERWQERQKLIEAAPDIPSPLETIEVLRTIIKNLQTIRTEAKIAAASGKSLEFKQATKRFKEEKSGLDEYVSALGPLSAEKLWREYIKAKMTHLRFRETEEELRLIESLLSLKRKEKALKALEIAGSKGFKLEEKIASLIKKYPEQNIIGEELEGEEDALAYFYDKNSPEYQSAKALLDYNELDETEKQRTKEESFAALNVEELNKRYEEIKKEREDLWEENIVRYFEHQERRRELIKKRDDEVWGMPSTIHLFNELQRIEDNYAESTIGAVLVGPPGAGKTTAIREFLKIKKRQMAYIDISGEVSRFTLFGARTIDVSQPLDEYNSLIEEFSTASDEDIKYMIAQGTSYYGEKFTKQFDSNLDALLKATGDKEKENIINNFKNKFTETLKSKKLDEILKKWTDLGGKNGFRYGFLVNALRNNTSIIIDEFNKAEDLTLLHSLMTAMPVSNEEAGIRPDLREYGEGMAKKYQFSLERLKSLENELSKYNESSPEYKKLTSDIQKINQTFEQDFKGWWYFADNNEWIRVPEKWRMYFTGNVGKTFKVHRLSPALASRMSGKVIEMTFPPVEEELEFMDISLSGQNGEYLRSPEDDFALFHLIKDIFPAIRENQEQETRIPTIPVSFRTIKDIAADLVKKETVKDSKTGKFIKFYSPTETNVDRAVFNHLIRPYALYPEAKEMVASYVDTLMNYGFFLSEEMEDEILKFVDRDALKRKRESFKGLEAKE